MARLMKAPAEKYKPLRCIIVNLSIYAPTPLTSRVSNGSLVVIPAFVLYNSNIFIVSSRHILFEIRNW
jgi:hypothetical protein